MLHAEPPRLGAWLLGGVASALALATVMLALGRPGRAHAMAHTGSGSRPSPSTGGSASGVAVQGDAGDSDFDTIVLADPANAPAPASDREPSPVHPFAVIRLPRFGPGTGTIPDTPAGRTLYAWLAAFNHADGHSLAASVTTANLVQTVAAQLALRQETGGFELLSAREVAPGVMVFRVRAQTTPTEALGTLRLRASVPAALQSFSLRALPTP